MESFGASSCECEREDARVGIPNLASLLHSPNIHKTPSHTHLPSPWLMVDLHIFCKDTNSETGYIKCTSVQNKTRKPGREEGGARPCAVKIQLDVCNASYTRGSENRKQSMMCLTWCKDLKEKKYIARRLGVV